MKYLDGEEWKEVIGSRGVWVSNMGRFRIGRKYIKTKENKDGYLNIYLGGKFPTAGNLAHRVVAEYFCEVPKGGKIEELCVDHINMDKHDNRAENLRWCTKKENTQYYIESLTDAQITMRAKMSDIIAVNDKGEAIQFNSTKACAEYFGIDTQYMSSIINMDRKRPFRGYMFYKLTSRYDFTEYDDGYVRSGANRAIGCWAEIEDGSLTCRVSDKYISQDGLEFRNNQASMRELVRDIMAAIKNSIPTEEQFEEQHNNKERKKNNG